MENSTAKVERQIRVAFYLRVSTDDQTDKYGLDLQRQALDLYIKSKGKFEDGRDKMILAGDSYVYTDDGISGTLDIEERKDFARLVEDMKSPLKPFDAVAVYKVDRLARKLIILLKIVNLFETYHVQFISVNETIDTSTPFGKAILNIMGVIAELEVETTKMRTEGGRKESFKSGTVQFSSYGYTKNIDKHNEILEKEAKIVRQIFELFVFKDTSTKEIASILQDQEVISPEISAIQNKKHKGKPRKINDMYYWRTDTVREILSNEVYIGNYYYNKTKNAKALPKSEWSLSDYHHEPIIEKIVFDKAQEKLRSSAAKTALNRKRKDDTLYLLSGLLKCGYCLKQDGGKEHSWNGERKEIGKGTKKYSYYYKCGHKNNQKYTKVCPTIPIPAEQLENYITAFVNALLTNPKITYDYQKELNSNKLSIRFLKEERVKLIKICNILPKKRTNILHQHKNNYLNDEELQVQMKELQEDTAKYKKRLEEIGLLLGRQELSEGYISNFAIYAKKYAGVLEDIHRDKKELYTLLHSLIEKITIDTRPFNPKFDRIAGVRKENQQIPNSIFIQLKLPDPLLVELTRYQLRKLEFVVRTPGVWTPFLIRLIKLIHLLVILA